MKTPTQNGTGRQSWLYKEEAKAFHAKRGFKPFTMVPNETLEVEMMNAAIAKEFRVLTAIRRFSWGNLCEYAVDAMPPKKPGDPKPRPLTQDQLGERLAISRSSMSEACRLLKEQGFVRADHPYLVPEEKISPLDSVENPESNPDSTVISSPYLRFEKLFFSRRVELKQSLTAIEAERKRVQSRNRELTKEVRKIKLAAFNAWRDFEREYEAKIGGEEEEKCILSYISELDPDSKMEYSGTPTPSNVESRIEKVKKPSKNAHSDPEPLKPFKTLNTIGALVSQSASFDGLTDRQHEILNSIPEDLLERLSDRPTPQLLDRIDRNIGRAPLQELTQRIRDRWQTITGLGVLPGFAADVLRAFNKREKDAQEGIPVQSETRSSGTDAAEELLRKKYGIN